MIGITIAIASILQSFKKTSKKKENMRIL